MRIRITSIAQQMPTDVLAVYAAVRRAYIVQYANEAYANFEAFTGGRIAALQIVDIKSQELSDPHPGAVLITGGMPHVSNCAAMTFGEGGQLVPVETAEELGANAILIRQSKMKTSGWTDYPYMQMKADAFVCDSVPEYMAWKIRAAK